MGAYISGLSNSSPELRAPASLAREGCSQAMMALLAEGREYLPKGVSLKNKIVDYDKKIAAIDAQIFTVKNFALDYHKEHGEFPLLKEVIQKIIVGHQDLVRSVLRLRSSDERVAYFVDETVKVLNFKEKEKEKFQKFIQERATDLNKRFNPRDPEQRLLREELENLWKNPYGDLGELKAALHFPGVDVLNLHLRMEKNNAVGPRISFHRNKVVAATQKAIEKIEGASPEALQSWQNRFPAIFTEQRMEDLKLVKQWLQTKEVDLVTKAKDGRYYFQEIKNYNKTATLEVLHESYRGKKTVWEQQQEMKQIIEFLELEDTYTPAISFLQGIDDEAKRALEQAGIMVIPYP
jgi:mRNA-degrading endonuclease RelE of RelBE toxin-antitoxin system